MIFSKALKTALFLLIFLSSTAANAQKYQNYISEFLSTQWWLGFRIGTNITQVNPIDRFSGISPVNYDASTLNKTYDDYNLAGIAAGLDITFYHKGWSIAFQPNFRRSRFSYQNSLFWEGVTDLERFETDFYQEQKVDFFDLPLQLKYDLLKKEVRPFISIGAYYSFITNA
ncbi:MAG: outer membrane beta-barrel protein, partial [Bacteroidota bacterium]